MWNIYTGKKYVIKSLVHFEYARLSVFPAHETESADVQITGYLALP